MSGGFDKCLGCGANVEEYGEIGVNWFFDEDGISPYCWECDEAYGLTFAEIKP